MEANVHADNCICEVCFRKPWAIAQISQILNDRDVDAVEAYLRDLTEEQREAELVPATA